MDFKTDYILENSKLILRPLVEEDYDQLLQFSLDEPEIWKFNAFGADSPENLKNISLPPFQTNIKKLNILLLFMINSSGN